MPWQEVKLTIKPGHFLPIAAIPVLLVVFFILFAFTQGNPGFKVGKSQHGLRVSEVYQPFNPVKSGDMIVGVNGLEYGQVLGFLASWPSQSTSGSFILEREGDQQTFVLKTIPHTLSSLLKIIWPHLLLITVLLSLGTIALLRAPLHHITSSFFVSLCGFSSAIACTLASNMGILSPPIQSASFLGLMVFNWLSFSAFLHFVCRFPSERDVIHSRPWLLAIFYFVPPFVTLLVAFTFGGFSWAFWEWLQRFRNLFLPVFIIGIFAKHVIDFFKLPITEPARNQIKLPLVAFWLSFGPYLFLYLLPYLLFDQPLINFRTVVLAYLVLPLAYLIAFLRYRLFDVDKMISKIIAYVVLIALVTGLYALLVVFLKRWLYGQQVLSEELFLVFLVLVVVLINPAANRLQQFINRVVFGNVPVRASTLHAMSRRIGTALEIDDLVHAITLELPVRFELNKAALAVIDNNQIHTYPAKVKLGLPKRMDAKQLIERFKDDEDYFRCSSVSSDSEHANQLHECGRKGWSIILKLRGAGSLIGLLFLGHKTNGRVLTEEDIHLLATLASHTGVALENGLRYQRLISSKKHQEATMGKLIQAEKMAAIGEMTTMLAHELKNPLAIIRGSAQYMTEGKRSPEVSTEMLGDIIDEVDTLNLSINSLLGLARQRPPALKPVNPSKVIPAIIKKWRNLDDHKSQISIVCECVLPDPPPTLHCDIGQLEQIMLNLIRNAEEAIEYSGKITVRVSCSDDDISIRLRDTGAGIKPHQLNRVFEHFFSTKGSGVGLGLAICKQLIEAHQGSISIKNMEGGGTEIRFLLPLDPSDKLTSIEV